MRADADADAGAGAGAGRRTAGQEIDEKEEGEEEPTKKNQNRILFPDIIHTLDLRGFIQDELRSLSYLMYEDQTTSLPSSSSSSVVPFYVSPSPSFVVPFLAPSPSSSIFSSAHIPLFYSWQNEILLDISINKSLFNKSSGSHKQTYTRSATRIHSRPFVSSSSSISVSEELKHFLQNHTFSPRDLILHLCKKVHILDKGNVTIINNPYDSNTLSTLHSNRQKTMGRVCGSNTKAPKFVAKKRIDIITFAQQILRNASKTTYVGSLIKNNGSHEELDQVDLNPTAGLETPACGRENQYASTLNQSNEKEVFLCMTCERVFANKYCLRRHISISGHTADPKFLSLGPSKSKRGPASIYPYKCGTCGNSYFASRNLKRHCSKLGHDIGKESKVSEKKIVHEDDINENVFRNFMNGVKKELKDGKNRKPAYSSWKSNKKSVSGQKQNTNGVKKVKEKVEIQGGRRDRSPCSKSKERPLGKQNKCDNKIKSTSKQKRKRDQQKVERRVKRCKDAVNIQKPRHEGEYREVCYNTKQDALHFGSGRAYIEDEKSCMHTGKNSVTQHRCIDAGMGFRGLLNLTSGTFYSALHAQLLFSNSSYMDDPL